MGNLSVFVSQAILIQRLNCAYTGLFENTGRFVAVEHSMSAMHCLQTASWEIFRHQLLFKRLLYLFFLDADIFDAPSIFCCVTLNISNASSSG
jgi:hypothetical protein